MTHGIFGSGRNWAAIAKSIAAQRSDWQTLLVDLRGHGDSPPMAPPHTVDACASDIEHLSVVRACAPHAMLGHSFGGKVALACAHRFSESLRQLWIVDSTPSTKAPSGSAWHMLDVIESCPGPFATRAEASSQLEAAGVQPRVASWMVGNLQRTSAALTWRLDTEQMRQLMEDFFRRDYWYVVEEPPANVSIHFVKATRSSVLDDEMCSRIEATKHAGERVFLHRVEGGHWINADNPTAIVALLAGGLPAGTPEATDPQ